MGFSWPDHVVDELKKLAATGLSAAVCASHFDGMSRNAAFGLGHRKGFQFLGKGCAHSGGPRSLRQARIKPKSNQAVQIDEAPRMLTLMELDAADCKWPFGNPVKEDFRYCGARQLFGRPYCSTHCRIAYETQQERIHARSQQGKPGNGGFFNNSIRHGESE